MIYVCEYDNSAANQTLLEAAEVLFPNKNVLSIKEADKTGIRWTKLRERILAWMLLEYALEAEDNRWIKEGKIAGNVENLEIVRTEHGKPYSSRYPELFFNISHCDAACACVISDCPVGIDIERKFEYKENLKRHVCCEEELRVLEAVCVTEKLCTSEKLGVSEKHTQLRFLWSMKEAFVKMDGRGLGYGLRNINLAEFLPVEDGICGRSRNCGNEQRSPDEAAEELSFFVKAAEKYTLAMCSKRQREGQQVQILSEQELMKWFADRYKFLGKNGEYYDTTGI